MSIQYQPGDMLTSAPSGKLLYNTKTEDERKDEKEEFENNLLTETVKK